MKGSETNNEIQSIAIDEINILNPRLRKQVVFSEIVENIKRVGLKRPITVRTSDNLQSGIKFDLVCGQGRIEAFQALGETHIPAIVIEETVETTLLKSLVENMARRQHRPLEQFVGIKALQEKGYDAKTISAKTGLNEPYTKIILDLLNRGEERLLAAVAKGHLPVDLRP
jgi:ParB family transcriptional regulator, chromosome partitioning protein